MPTLTIFSGRYQFGSGQLVVPETSELAFLRNGTPVVHIAVRDVRGRFGHRIVDRMVPELAAGRMAARRPAG
jgi:hypothetical protein